MRNSSLNNGLTCVLALSLLLCASGCVICTSSCERTEVEEETLSLKGAGREFGRGITNVGLCWLEVPSTVDAKLRDDCPGDPFGIVSPVWDITWGSVVGTFRAVQRAAGGVVEVGLSPFPPYDPLMELAFPPYIEPVKAPREEECPRDCSCDAEE